jgi:hypothetical protein
MAAIPALAQPVKNTTEYEQIWLAYFNQTRFSKRWGMWLDMHLRTEDNFTDSLSLWMIRPGLTYYVDDKTKITVGYTYAHHAPGDNHPATYMPEHRIWQQIQWHTNYRKLRTMQWVRLEERFRRKTSGEELVPGYNFNWRLRYNFMLQGPVNRKAYTKGGITWVFNDELHVNFGEEIVYNYFDQNRLFLGFHFFFSDQSWLQAGYMNLFQQLSSGSNYRMLHTARVVFFQNFDLRK